MRRALRHAFTILAGVSLLLCVGTCVLWVRSGLGETIERVDSGRRVSITSHRGVIMARIYDGEFDPQHVPKGSWKQWGHWLFRSFRANWQNVRPLGHEHWWQRLGFNAGSGSRVPLPRGGVSVNDWLYPTWSGQVRAVAFPYWAVVVVLGAWPLALAIRVFRRSLRTRAGLCASCGYDLRASPERCPECGTVPARAVR